jgi:hypothetical protein
MGKYMVEGITDPKEDKGNPDRCREVSFVNRVDDGADQRPNNE